ncbi:MAG: LD-carboxypeptidase [Ignavibacteriaceae bacterium]|nr:LD-carboxypeptidase [Ignavibacteriaceae bacterium]
MRIVKPKKLQQGDLIGILSPASSPDDLERIEKGVKYLEKRGYKVLVAKHVGKNHGYLAGTDSERLNDLHNLFQNKEVKAIICVRGGYGTPRLLDKIDYKKIKNNPKIFIGYSDITALQMAFLKNAGLVTFAGPMLAVDFYDEVNTYAEDFFWKMITSEKKMGKVELPENENIFKLTKGNASGMLVGGNLALIAGLIGTNYLPSFKNSILFLEDVGEVPYRIDRMLSQLKLSGALDEIAGVILGSFSDCNEHDPMKKTLSLGEVIDDYFGHLNIPVVYNFPHGHIPAKATLPFGIEVKVNAAKEYIEFTEGAVS